MRVAILDCYTDEPSGLGVMPYIGTYPRYIAGAFIENGVKDIFYITIDDLRATIKRPASFETAVKTPIKVRNCTPNMANTLKILSTSDVLIIIAGIHTPGKYLSAYPGTTKEVRKILDSLGIRTFSILTGPAASVGSGQWGGKKARPMAHDTSLFDRVVPNLEYAISALLENNFTEVPETMPSYDALRSKAMLGAIIMRQLPHDLRFHTAEVETMRGCAKANPCSFCTEKLKSDSVERRDAHDIIDEVKALSKEGMRNIRLGKQTCIYSYGANSELKFLLSNLQPLCDILHIDNVNPLYVDMEKTKTIVKYCTPGNVASMGVESFDPVVIQKNNLGTSPELVYEKVKLINDVGGRRGPNGMPSFLPGINILFGLTGESKSTHDANMEWLRKILDDGLMLRRINIREVVIFPGTQLSNDSGNKFLRKNRSNYWKWRNAIRHEIDNPMLLRIAPKDTIIKGLRTEIYDGNTTFARQVGTYPLIVGIKGRIGLDRFIDVAVTDHMLRSVVGNEVLTS